LSGEKVEIGLVPFGSIGMSVFALDLFWTSHTLHAGPNLVGIAAFLGVSRHWHVLLDLFLLSCFSGFYSVPLYALIQSRCEPTHRARIIAANNILNALFMIVSQVLAIVLLGPLHFTLPELFLVTAVLNAAVAIYIYGLVPEFLMRFLAWLLIHTFYDVRAVHPERIPSQGAAVLVCNHVSFVDAVVIMAECPRPIRFVMDHQIFKIPVLSFMFRTARAIPIASAKDDPKVLDRANRLIDEALAEGDLVCIFPEGKITQTGELNRFRSGVQQIVERNPVPVYPMALRGLWGSFFSRFSGAAFSSIPRPLRRGMLSRLELVVGNAIPAMAVTPEGLQNEVNLLRGERA
jgi:1-acyl-sn-glycerol-3-phosphate acyltransferase